jgi:hypothetical protein
MKDVCYKIIARDPSTPAGYDGCALFLARDMKNSTRDRNFDSYLLTREALNKGDEVEVECGVEFLPVDSKLMPETRHGLKVFLYRPEKCMDSNVVIKSEEASHQYSTLEGYRLFNAERNSSGGYAPTLMKVFSQVAYKKNETIPASELITTYGNPRYGSRHPYYVHDQKMYQNRIWDSIKAFCR